MKLSITLKDPDGFWEAVDRAVKSQEDPEMDEDERESLRELRTEKTWRKLETWVDCQEYITIDFDTEAGTATVRKRQ